MPKRWVVQRIPKALRVAKWGNSLAVRFPVALVEALDLKVGDEIVLDVSGKRSLVVRREMEGWQAPTAKCLPNDFDFQPFTFRLPQK